jgi:hypothetical protein
MTTVERGQGRGGTRPYRVSREKRGNWLTQRTRRAQRRGAVTIRQTEHIQKNKLTVAYRTLPYLTVAYRTLSSRGRGETRPYRAGSFPTGCGVRAGSGEAESFVQCYTVLYSVMECYTVCGKTGYVKH